MTHNNNNNNNNIHPIIDYLIFYRAKLITITHDVELNKIAEITEGFSGADISAIANTAISLVLHEYLHRYYTPEQAAKHASEAFISMRHFEDAVTKIKTQREMKSKEGMALSQYM